MKVVNGVAVILLVALCVLVLFCGMLGLITGDVLWGGVTALVGLLLGLVAVVASKHRGRSAVAVALAALALVAVVFGPSLVHVFASSRQASRSTACMSNLKRLGIALGIYISESNERFPPASRWLTLSKPYGAEELHCPWERTPFSYAMNEALSGFDAARVEDPATTVMVFEMDAHVADAHGGQGDACLRHGRGMMCAVDGHVRAGAENSWKP